MRKNGEIKQCKACGSDYYVPLYRLDNTSFCSRECLNKTQYNQAKHTCFNCKSVFSTSPSRKGKRKFCSMECYYENMDKNKKNIKSRAEIARAVRLKKGNRLTPKSLLKDVEKMCFVCGYKEHTKCLDYHHVDQNPYNNVIENVAILCVMCHRKFHRGLLKKHEIEIMTSVCKENKKRTDSLC